MASVLASFVGNARRRIARALEVRSAIRTLRSEDRGRMSISGNVGPEGILQGIYTSSVGTPPLINTRALLELHDTAPWLRAITEKIGSALGMTDWRLYAVGKPPASKTLPSDYVTLAPGQDYFVVKSEELAAAVGAWASDEVARRVRKIRGQLEPWARRDPILQRQFGPARWKNLDHLRRQGMLHEIAEHPFYDALETPNPFMGRMGLMKLTEASLDLVGDAFWLKERNVAGTPVGYWPIPAHWIVETPTPYRPFFRVNWRSFVKAIPESEIRWFHEPAPIHPYDRGSGMGWALGDELEIDEYLAKMTKQMFFNDADPKWIFAGGEGTSEQEMRRLERDFMQRNQGFWRKFKPYFLVGGGEDINKRIHEFQRPTMEQLVYPGLRKAQRDVVLQCFGAPPELFGITENSNRATVEAAEYLFARWVLLPRGERLRTTLQLELAMEFDERLVIDFPSPVAEDKDYELNVRKAATWAWDADEWRHLAGDAPMEAGKGKVYLVPMNSYITDDLTAPPPAKPAAAAPTPPAARLAELDVMKASAEAAVRIAEIPGRLAPAMVAAMGEAIAKAAPQPAQQPPPLPAAPPPPPAPLTTGPQNVTVNAPDPTPGLAMLSDEIRDGMTRIGEATAKSITEAFAKLPAAQVDVSVAAPQVTVEAPQVNVKNELKTPKVQDMRIVEMPHIETAITDVPETVTETKVERDDQGIKTTVAHTRRKKK